MNFFEQPCSTQWAALEYRGEKIAEVWFKPEGDPFVLVFRIPQWIFQIPGMGPQLTTENLLKAVAIAPEEVESWGHGDVFHWGMNGSNPELRIPLPPPRQVTHLDIYVRLKPPPEAAARQEDIELEVSLKRWQELEVRWKAILALETTMETLSKSMESLLLEMEASLTKTLMLEEKIHALRRRCSMGKGKKSRSFSAPEDERIYPSFHLVDGLPRKKAACGTLQRPH